jgi:hypothetical protein
MNVVAGNITVSGTASVGAAAGVPVITKTTEAYIGQNTSVTALGTSTPIAVETGLSLATTKTTFNPASALQPDGTTLNRVVLE